MRNVLPDDRLACLVCWQMNRAAVKEEHERLTQPNYQAKIRAQEKKDAADRWRKELQVREGAVWSGVSSHKGRGCLVWG